MIDTPGVAQAMEHRYTVLAEEQGRLAATNNRIESERQQLAKVLSPCLDDTARNVEWCSAQCEEKTSLLATQERQEAKSEAHALQTTVLERDASLQRKDVQVLIFRGVWRPMILHAASMAVVGHSGTGLRQTRYSASVEWPDLAG